MILDKNKGLIPEELIKVRKIILILFLLFNVQTFFAQGVDAISFEINIKPSSGGNEGYILKLQQNTLIVNLMSLKSQNNEIVFDKEKKQDSYKLSKSQLKKITRILDNLNMESEFNNYKGLIFDTWEYELYRNKRKLFFNQIDLGNKELKEVNRLIDYLKRISPIPIKLRSFS